MTCTVEDLQSMAFLCESRGSQMFQRSDTYLVYHFIPPTIQLSIQQPVRSLQTRSSSSLYRVPRLTACSARKVIRLLKQSLRWQMASSCKLPLTLCSLGMSEVNKVKKKPKTKKTSLRCCCCVLLSARIFFFKTLVPLRYTFKK